MQLKRAVIWLAAVAGAGGCDSTVPQRCGPATGVVSRVIDGDTVDLESGERIRYLMIDAPELSDDACFAVEAKDLNASLVLGQTVSLDYDVECEDRFGRLLAYISVGDREINKVLVERGYACVLHIPPNGDDRLSEFDTAEAIAEMQMRGMWGQCLEIGCR